MQKCMLAEFSLSSLSISKTLFCFTVLLSYFVPLYDVLSLRSGFQVDAQVINVSTFFALGQVELACPRTVANF